MLTQSPTLTLDLQQTLNQIVAYFEAHPEQLQDGAYTTLGVLSRREGNVKAGAQELIVAVRGFRNLGEFSRQHGPFQGTELFPQTIVTFPAPAVIMPPQAAEAAPFQGA